MELTYVWTNGSDEVFRKFYLITEDYYSTIVGGKEKRSGFIPYNISSAITDVLIVYDGDTPVACSGIKRYSDEAAEIKRVWVDPEYRKNHIAGEMMDLLEAKAREMGFAKAVLQTRPQMEAAVSMYLKRGYVLIDNYPPYDKLDGAICFAKELQS